MIGQFLSDHFVQTLDYSDKVKLTEIWSMLRSTRAYFDQLGFKQSRQLSEKLRNKGLTLSKVGGSMCLRYFKAKENKADDYELLG